MSIKRLIVAAALGAAWVASQPALAEGHGGGHAAGGHMGGGHAPSGAHFGGGAHFAGPARYAGAVGRPYGGIGSHGYPTAYHGSGAYQGGAYAGHGAYGYPGGHYYGHGYSTGAYWGGGYWHGGYWPRAYYGVGFSWFLPVLPLAYATYWYSGIPYYYANDVYYTYDPSYEGYVATDPPPVADSSNEGSAAVTSTAGAAPMDGGAPPPNAPMDAGQIFMYPKNGQSAEQTASDRAACQQWASEQAGQVAQNPSDYRRAMVACVEGRGYSAR
jgi:hypothetical protein